MPSQNTVTSTIRASANAGSSSTSTHCEPATAEGEPATKRQRLSNQPKSGPTPEPFPGLAHHLVSADAYKDAIFMQLDQQHFHGTNPGLLAHLKLGAQGTFSRLPVSSINPQERLLSLSSGQMVARTQEEVELHLYLEAHFSGVSQKPPEVMPSTTAPNTAAAEPLCTPAQQKAAEPESPPRASSLTRNVLRSEFKPEQTAGAYAAIMQAFVEYTSTTFVAQDTVDGTAKVTSVRHGNEHVPASKDPTIVPTADECDRIAANDQAELKNSAKWQKWKDSHNITTVENSPAGTNNCLLLSLLQHASGRYDQSAMHEHQEMAESLRAEMLNRKFSDVTPNNLLRFGGEGVQWATQKINEMYARNLQIVAFHLGWTNGKNSDVVPWASVETQGSEPVAIFVDGTHFEAVILKQ